MTTFNGTIDDDTIVGSNTPDTINGQTGDDLIAGFGDGSGVGGTLPPLSESGGGVLDADSLVGGNDNDTIHGGGGADTIRGGSGRDLIFGGQRADELFGGNGADTLHGGAASDHLSGGGDRDSLYGENGNDQLFGDGGDDALSGDRGQDALTGGAGRDSLEGGDGNDRLQGDGGNDKLVGGEGEDVAVFAGNLADYEIITVGATTTVRDLAPSAAGDDGTDTLNKIEQARFADGVVLLPPTAPSIDLETLTPTQGFVIAGVDEGDRSGFAVSDAGDVNGDGFDDVIIGARGGDAAGNAKSYAGESYVIFGTDADFGSVLDLATLAASQGFRIYGAEAGDGSAHSVSAAGDVNGDGFDDVIIGAPLAAAAGNAKPSAGESYVIFGTDAGFGASLDLAALTPAQGLVIYGADAQDSSGIAVSGAGDVNGDGLDDLIVGAPRSAGAGNAEPEAGESYVIFGKETGSGASIDLATLSATDGFTIYGADADNSFGDGVSSAGDVNGDGFDDVIVGAVRGTSEGGTRTGESYVIFGTDAGFGASLDLATLTPAQGFVIEGVDAFDGNGFSVSGGGDVNGDGFDDLVIGAFGADAAANAKDTAGESYIVFGTDAGFGASVDLTTLTPEQGLVMYGADREDRSGFSVSTAGDVNGDGFDDIIVGAYFADSVDNARPYAGESYVVFGTDDGFGPSIDFNDFVATQGFIIYGARPSDGLGRAVSAAGDIDNDGFDDLIIGAVTASPGNKGQAGQSYVIYGSATIGDTSFALTDDIGVARASGALPDHGEFLF
jgi:hypothetical protein